MRSVLWAKATSGQRTRVKVSVLICVNPPHTSADKPVVSGLLCALRGSAVKWRFDGDSLESASENRSFSETKKATLRSVAFLF